MALIDKDIDAPSKSALDHIHNVVAEREYQRGYEQGKADANHPEIPDSWIPVSERLPEKDGIYLVSGGDQVWSAQCVTFGCFRGWSNDARNPAVSAWMPLPEPWEGN